MADIEGRFEPAGSVPRSYVQNYREAASINFAGLGAWVNRMPESREKSLALTHLEVAHCYADKCIVAGELEMKGGQIVVPPLDYIDPDDADPAPSKPAK